jgi:hypothetical protein
MRAASSPSGKKAVKASAVFDDSASLSSADD